MNPFGNFSFEKSAARTHTQLSENEAATYKKPKLSPPFAVPTMRDKSPSIKTKETAEKENITSTSLFRSTFASGAGADASASRAFFGLSGSDYNIRSSSLFSSPVPVPASAQKTTGSIFQFTPLKETAAGDERTSSWFSSWRPSKQDTNAANTTSLFSSLPKTTIGAGFTLSKTSETKSLENKQKDNQPDGPFAGKTAGATNKITQ